MCYCEQGYLLKKTFRSTEREREDIKAKEKLFLDEILLIDPENLVFLDEAGFHLAMTRTHARSIVGTRAFASMPPKGSNISFIGAVRLTGVCAIYPYDGPVDGFRFLDYLDQQLLPKLKKGDVVVMDNLRVHHIEEVKARLGSVGARPLFLPPYSPERNPIEEIWSLVKGIFRKQEPRTIVQLVNTLKIAISEITPEKISAYFAHAGYD